MMPAEAITPDDSTSVSSAIFIVDDRDYQQDPLVRDAKFDGNEPKYRCFCCCHVWVCTLLVGVVELILLVLNLIFTAAAYGAEPSEEHGSTISINAVFLLLRSERSLTAGAFGALIGFVVVGLLIHGVLKQKHRFLLPHLTMQLLAIIASIVVAGLFAIGSLHMSARVQYSASSGKDDWTYVESLFNRRFSYRQSVSVSVVLTCLTVLQAGFFIAVLRCYVYLKEISRKVECASYLPMVAVKRGVPNA